MHPVSPAFRETIRSGHQYTGYCEAWLNGQRIAVDDGLGNETTLLPLHESGSNAVTVDVATPGVRRTASLTLVKIHPSLWEALAPVGVELRPYVTTRPYPSGAADVVPQGVFPIDVLRDGGDTISITAPDRWSLVKNARFLTPRSFGGQTARGLIADLLREVLPVDAVVTDLATSTATVPAQTEDRDRAGLIQKLATAAAVDVFFDRFGNAVIRDVPTIDITGPAWDVDYGGVLIGVDRERNRQRTYNVVVVNGTNSKGDTVFPTQFVWDNDPRSPTYAGPGSGFGPTPPPASGAGPFGQRPTFYSSPLLTRVDQAVAAGQSILARVTGLAAQVTAAAIPNPALDDGDTIRVTLPPAKRNAVRPVEYHLVDGFTVPLVANSSGQSIGTRSTRADDVDES